MFCYELVMPICFVLMVNGVNRLQQPPRQDCCRWLALSFPCYSQNVNSPINCLDSNRGFLRIGGQATRQVGCLLCHVTAHPEARGPNSRAGTSSILLGQETAKKGHLVHNGSQHSDRELRANGCARSRAERHPTDNDRGSRGRDQRPSATLSRGPAANAQRCVAQGVPQQDGRLRANCMSPCKARRPNLAGRN